VTLLELFAASLLIVGSVLVLWTVIRADLGSARLAPRRAGPRPAEDDMRRAA
jgi:hypothetical protein